MNRSFRLKSVAFLASASLLFAISGITANVAAALSIGACCLPFGTCLIEEPLACGAIDGVYQGDDTTCENTECPDPTTTTTTSTTTTTLPSILCGDANNDETISAPDALFALKTSVGTAECIPERCDYNGNGMVQSSDALLILKVAVGASIEPQCPTLPTTTTSTTTST